MLVYVMVFAQGALGYGLTSIMGAVVAEIFQGKHYGSIFGTIMMVALAGGAAGPFVTGVLHDLSGSYTLAFMIGIGVSGLSALGDLAGIAGQNSRGRGPAAPGARLGPIYRLAVTGGMWA